MWGYDLPASIYEPTPWGTQIMQLSAEPIIYGLIFIGVLAWSKASTWWLLANRSA